jgi:hypothetical protein
LAATTATAAGGGGGGRGGVGGTEGVPAASREEDQAVDCTAVTRFVQRTILV